MKLFDSPDYSGYSRRQNIDARFAKQIYGTRLPLEKGLVVGAIVLVFLFVVMAWVSGSYLALLDIPSLLFVGIGTLGAGLVQCGLGPMHSACLMGWATLREDGTPEQDRIEWLTNLAGVVRTDGRLAAERMRDEVGDAPLRAGLEIIADGLSEQDLRRTVGYHFAARAAANRDGIYVFDTLGGYAPAFGLMGTVLGLVNLLGALGEPARMGPQMALALLTTLYGAILANIIFLPLAGRLRRALDRADRVSNLTVEGLVCVLKEESPVLLAQKLEPFAFGQDDAA